MATWSEFAEAAPAMAALGADRFQTAEVAYLGTVRMLDGRMVGEKAPAARPLA